MPFFNVACKSCGASDKLLASDQDEALANRCSCGGTLVRRATGPSAQKVEVLDNGAMARAVERPADAERLYKERHDSADPLAGQSLRPNND